jgi:branched-chain amino acid transport system substrate-binding protein
MKQWIKFSMVVIAVILFVAGGSTLCFGQAKKPLKFVILTDLTGPAHAQVGSQGWATEDYFTWLNQQGGIEGHPVQAEVIDTKYQLPLIRTAYARVKEMKQTAVSFNALSGGIEALRGQFATDKIPVLMITGHGPALYPPSWVVTVMPPYDDTLCAMADWIAGNWKEKRKPRLALFLGDYASGRSPELAKWYCEKKGIEIAAVEYCPLLPTDTSDLLIRIRDTKPDFIFDTLMPDQAKVALRDRAKLGIKTPQANFVFNSDQIMKTVPLEAYIDYMGFQPCASWWEKTVPGIQLAHQLYKKRGDIPTLTYCATIGACMVWAEAVRNALKKVGYEKVDGPAIFEGYLGIKNFTAQGIFKEISYTREDLRGNLWLKICKFNKDGSISNVTDYMQAPWNLKLKAEMEKEKK